MLVRSKKEEKMVYRANKVPVILINPPTWHDAIPEMSCPLAEVEAVSGERSRLTAGCVTETGHINNDKQ